MCKTNAMFSEILKYMAFAVHLVSTMYYMYDTVTHSTNVRQ